MKKRHRFIIASLLVIQWAWLIALFFDLYKFNLVKSIVIIAIIYFVFKLRVYLSSKFRIKHLKEEYASLNRKNRRKIMRELKTKSKS